MAWSSEGRDPAAAKSAAEGGARLRRAGGERGAQSQPRRHCSRAPNSGGDGDRGAGGGRAGPSPPVRSARGLARPQGTAHRGRKERRGSAARSRGGLGEWRSRPGLRAELAERTPRRPGTAWVRGPWRAVEAGGGPRGSSGDTDLGDSPPPRPAPALPGNSRARPAQPPSCGVPSRGLVRASLGARGAAALGVLRPDPRGWPGRGGPGRARPPARPAAPVGPEPRALAASPLGPAAQRCSGGARAAPRLSPVSPLRGALGFPAGKSDSEKGQR